MKIHNCEQGSPEWFDIRAGKMTASHAQAIGNNGKGLETYIMELMANYYSKAEPENYTNADIERGNELEETARQMYELEKNCFIEQVGFVERNEFSGCSPDGLIGKEGGIEIKCPKDSVYFRLLIDGDVESKYLWQVQMSLLITGRKWWDLVFYNPNFTKSISVYHIKPDKEKQDKILEGLKTGESRIKELKKKYETAC